VERCLRRGSRVSPARSPRQRRASSQADGVRLLTGPAERRPDQCGQRRERCASELSEEGRDPTIHPPAARAAPARHHEGEAAVQDVGVRPPRRARGARPPRPAPTAHHARSPQGPDRHTRLPGSTTSPRTRRFRADRPDGPSRTDLRGTPARHRCQRERPNTQATARPATTCSAEPTAGLAARDPAPIENHRPQRRSTTRSTGPANADTSAPASPAQRPHHCRTPTRTAADAPAARQQEPAPPASGIESATADQR
jgi:hypothetical protein